MCLDLRACCAVEEEAVEEEEIPDAFFMPTRLELLQRQAELHSISRHGFARRDKAETESKEKKKKAAPKV